MGRKRSRKATKSWDWATEKARFQAVLSDRYIGQPEVSALFAGLMATFSCAPIGGLVPLPRVLIAGPTSSGKSFLIEQVTAALNARTAFVDASALTSPGYKGMNLSEALEPLLNDRDVREARRRGVLVLDEFDKLAQGSKRDAWLKQTEHNLLPILNGDRVQISDAESGEVHQVSTRHILVLACGVFDGMTPALWRDPAKAQGALVRFGFGSELVGRFSHFVRIEKPNRAAFCSMLEKEEENLRPLYRIGDWVPAIDRRAFGRIAENAYRSPFGIRSARVELHARLFELAQARAKVSLQ